MPLAPPPRPDVAQKERINELLSRVKKTPRPVVEEYRPEQTATSPTVDKTDLWLLEYEELAQKTKNIPLSHLGCCKEGSDLFNDLCMWVDINQKYVDTGMFPQWNDLAKELNIDQMKTEWVKVCVRPEQSFTRAILEIYMNDGGTLGDVIEALRKQGQFRIIQEITDKTKEFMELYNTYHKSNFNPDGSSQTFLYSILRTLFETFTKVGQEDPLNAYQQYSKGFKSYFKGLNHIQPSDTDLVVNAVQMAQPTGIESHDSGYTSPYRYGGTLPPMQLDTLPPKKLSEIKGHEKKVALDEKGDKVDITMRVLLFFAKDGVDHAQQMVEDIQDFRDEDYPDVKVDLFRLNEHDLWNALLINPEACIQKWLDEMDFVIPILTPEFIQDLHRASIGSGAPAPTCPMINKYIYNLLRTTYVAEGCQNKKVRPAMPTMYSDQLHRSTAVTTEPLFRMWKPTDKDTMRGRIKAMVKVWCKSRGM